MKHRRYSRGTLEPEAFLSHSITVTGKTAVGTSTTMKALEGVLPENHGWKFISAGDIMRRFAREQGVSIEEFARWAKEHPEEGWDQRCDEAVRQEGLYNFRVIEGRLPHIFCPHSFHVLVLCPIEIRARRRQKRDGRYKELSLGEVEVLTRERDEDDESRYELLYPGWNWTQESYDLVLKSHKMNPDERAREIVTRHMEWYARGGKKIVNLSRIP